MAQRKIADVVKKQPYFEAAPVDSSVTEEGSRDMGVQYPFRGPFYNLIMRRALRQYVLMRSRRGDT